MAHLGSMKERGLRPRTISSRWQAISRWLNWCVEFVLIESSPASKIKRPKVPKTRKPFLAEEEFDALLAQCPMDTLAGARRQAMIWMMATNGIRRLEMWSLTRGILIGVGQRFGLSTARVRRSAKFHSITGVRSRC